MQTAQGREDRRLKHVRQDLGGERRPDGGDAVDAQLAHGDQLAEDEPVGLHRGESEQRAHEDPPSEAQECADCGRVPMKAVRASGKERVAEDQPSRGGDDPAENESPDASGDQRRHHHDRQPHRLRPDIDRGEPSQGDASRDGEQLRGVEAGQDRRESNHRNQSGERRLLVEVRQGNRRCSGDRKERKTSRRPGWSKRCEGTSARRRARAE